MYDLGPLLADPDFLDDLGRSFDPSVPPPLLRCAKIKITSRCNLRCVMCKYWQTESEDTLTSERWRAVFGELAELGCRKLHFSGGEVFLRPDFLDLVESAAGAGMRVNMTTNGTLVSREAVKRMADIGVNSVSISLDGPTASAHNEVRGRDYAWKRSVRAVRWLRRDAPKTKVRINFVVMRGNYERLPEMVRLAGELGVRELIPMPVDEKGESRNRLSKTQIRHYNQEVAPRVAELRARYGFSVEPAYVYPFGVTEEEVRLSSKGLYARGFFERRACLVPWMHAFFAWNGETYLCCMTNGRMESLGNVGTQSVREVFHGAGFRKIREDFLAGRHLSSCHRCDLFLAENARLHAALDEAGRAPSPFLRRERREAMAPEQGVDGPFEPRGI
jgi:MoaA/NifB/PqqE/SkfB family radical SAM enzyme